MSYYGRIPLDRKRVFSRRTRERFAERRAVVETMKDRLPRGRTRRLKEIGVVKVSVHTLLHNPSIRQCWSGVSRDWGCGETASGRLKLPASGRFMGLETIPLLRFRITIARFSYKNYAYEISRFFETLRVNIFLINTGCFKCLIENYY